MLCHLPQKNCLKELLTFYFPSSPNKDVKEVGLYSPSSHSAFDTDQSTFSSQFSPKQQKGTCFEFPIDFPTVKLLPPPPPHLAGYVYRSLLERLGPQGHKCHWQGTCDTGTLCGISNIEFEEWCNGDSQETAQKSRSLDLFWEITDLPESYISEYNCFL